MLFLYDIWQIFNDLPQVIVFLIGSNCVCVFFSHFYYALSRQLVIKNKTGGHEKQNYNLCKPIFSTKTRDHKRFGWLIRYIMQDLKYLHLSIDYETNIQILIDVCERHMAKEIKGIKRKYLLKVSIDKALVNQNQLLSTKSNNN